MGKSHDGDHHHFSPKQASVQTKHEIELTLNSPQRGSSTVIIELVADHTKQLTSKAHLIVE